MTADVQRPLLRGSQQVAALWFDCALLGEDEARRRLLAAWETGSRAYRAGAGYLLAWKTARRLQCEAAPGLALCDQDGVFASAPLLPHERAGIAPGAAVLVFGASLHVYALDAGTRIDPSSWLGLSNVPVCTALAMPRQADPGFARATPEAARDVRTLLGNAVPPPSAERGIFMRDAMQRAARVREGGTSLAGKAGSTAGLLAGLLLRPLAALLGGGGGSGGGKARPGVPPPSALGDWLAARVARLAALTRVGQLLGWRQANYLRKMLRQFDEGNLDEALRHAIPLDSPHAPTRQAFGVGRRRANLEIGGGASASGIGLDTESLGLLRAAYQRSFDMLDRAGRIDEAVFVLAELLNRRQEAVDYLERKGRIAQAAQLAETLGLAPAIAVRLHFMAGNVARAVLLARLSGCFAVAVPELERRGDPGAAQLRLEWAQYLAASGELAEAAYAVWPLAQERQRALAWLRDAEAAGGMLGVQGLLYTLALDPQALRARQAALRALLSAPGLDAARQRQRACECLLRLDGHNEATRRFAGALWRVLMLERRAWPHALPAARLAGLLKLAADPVLADDLPQQNIKDAAVPKPLLARTAALQLRFAETGLHALEDVRALPDGGHLLALGEGGVVLAREGVAAPASMRWPVPAHHLVVSRNGRRALALARREKTVRVSRIDLVSGKVDDWFSAALRFWADEFDGATWSVVADGRLMVLDVAAPGRSVLWQVGDLPAPIIGFQRQGERETLLIGDGSMIEQWRYALPDRRLLGRDRMALAEHILAVLPDSEDDFPLLLGASGTRLSLLRQPGVAVDIPWPHQDLSQARLYGKLLLLCFDDADGCQCRVLDRGGRLLADIVLPEARGARASLHGGHVLAWDRRGRVVDVDIETAAVRMLTFE